MKEFDLHVALDNVESVCVDNSYDKVEVVSLKYLPEARNGFRLIAIFKSDNENINLSAGFFFDNGIFNRGFIVGNLKLKAYPREGWINIIRNQFGHIYTTGPYPSSEMALAEKVDKDRIDTIKINWEE